MIHATQVLLVCVFTAMPISRLVFTPPVGHLIGLAGTAAFYLLLRLPGPE